MQETIVQFLKMLLEFILVLPACPHIQIFDFGGHELNAN